MIHIDVKKQKGSLGLNKSIIHALINNYTGVAQLDRRLWHLPIIPKGKNVGQFPRTNVSRYCIHRAADENLDLYIGYFVYKHSQTGKWSMHEHVFNVDPLTERVSEGARGMNWDHDSYYVGMRVPQSDWANEKYVANFSELSYIKEHSSRGLLDIPKQGENDDESLR